MKKQAPSAKYHIDTGRPASALPAGLSKVLDMLHAAASDPTRANTDKPAADADADADAGKPSSAR
ncbi:hypothetical protein VK98_10155 [Chromobacterium sp. LK11]|uniref:hypothetical protein n=1 Tax=Chromobacterium sp. LK11 TaxID=1628212 RepID=UPI0006549514|nr:hypothetical protein [Chromobacterium sp. LK11]KMN81976.1 hypothetical protein VK98_10155 [Chromobacterium sp. LK11]